MSNPTDADLLKQYALSRRPDAFAEIVRRHSGLIYAVARRLTGSDADALDVAQSCFLMGDTAVAFRVRWYRPDAGANWNGAAPVGEQAEERQRIAAALGVPLEITWCNAGNPARPEVISRIVQAIDSGSPVLAYLSPHRDVAVVYGYADNGRTVLVRDYYDKPGRETAHPASQLGSLFVFLNQPTSPAKERRDACIVACRAAVQNWYRVDHPRFDDEGSFAYGDQAYAPTRARMRRIESRDCAWATQAIKSGSKTCG